MTDDDSSASNRALCHRLARGPRRPPKPPHENGGMTVRQMLTGATVNQDAMLPEFIELRDAVRQVRRALTDALGAEPSAYIIVDAAREIIRARSSKMPS